MRIAFKLGLDVDAQAGEAELGEELLRAAGDAPSQVRRLEHDGLAAEAENLTHEPLGAAHLLLGGGAAVAQGLGAPLDLPARDPLRVVDARYTGVAQPVGLEALAGLELLRPHGRGAHPVEPEASDVLARAIPRVYVPVRQLPLEPVRLDRMRDDRLLTDLDVLDVHEPPALDALAEGADEAFLDAVSGRLGRLEIELAERLLELPSHLVERTVSLSRDHRPHELERQSDCPRLEGRQARRRAEGVAEQLLVHVDVVAPQFGVDRVTAAAEVHEVEQREMLFECLR